MNLGDQHRPVIIGLAGGIGAGKSHIARLFAAEGCVVSDSDALAKAALDEPDVRNQIVQWWGAGVMDGTGRIDRARVAKVIFGDGEARRRLEQLVHPRVHAARARQIEQATATGAPALVIDAPLLFEAGVDKECDAVVYIDCPHDERLARVRARGWDEAELARREAAQWPLHRKRAACQFLIDNAGDRQDQAAQVRRVLRDILSTSGDSPLRAA